MRCDGSIEFKSKCFLMLPLLAMASITKTRSSQSSCSFRMTPIVSSENALLILEHRARKQSIKPHEKSGAVASQEDIGLIDVRPKFDDVVARFPASHLG